MALAAGVACLSACSLAPTYQRPTAAALPDAYEATPPGWKAAQPADQAVLDTWWTRFEDPTLNDLIARVAVDNQSLQGALARHEQALAAAGIAHALSSPVVSLNASATRARQSEAAPRRSATSPNLSTDLVLGVNASYELDVWGRVRNAISAGDARAQASAADVATLALSLRTDLANLYFTLRGTELTVRSLEALQTAYTQSLSLTERRYAGGLVTQLDVEQARGQLEGTRVMLADLKLRSAQLTHAIAALVGTSASGFTVPAGTLPTHLPDVALGQPSALLEQRPDVAAAERRVMAASADIGVARAAYFPVFSIGGGAGFESSKTASWLEAPNRFWSIGPQLLANLLDGGRIDNQVRQARSALDEATANYRQTVLVANKEAEDSLSAIHWLAQEAVSQAALKAAADQTFNLAMRQYESGLLTYLPVASAQATQSQAQIAAINLQVAQLSARVQLIKSLGGGWHAQP
ncbi:MAG: efflux transporter outer membrane subunit [Aquabacterium sp.]